MDEEPEMAAQVADVPADGDPIDDEQWEQEGEILAADVVDDGEEIASGVFARELPDIADSPRAMPRDQILEEFRDKEPTQWGEFVEGVETRLPTSRQAVALTLDACDRGYDAELIEFLEEREIPATLFVTGYFADAHPELLERLSDEPLFEIANHGLAHRPCSVTGKKAAEIEGTGSVEEAYVEIAGNADIIEELTGERPAFYRSGTAYYDEICTRIARRTGHRVAGFDVVGDLGATYSADQVEEAVTGVEPGSIVVAHMNKPDGGTREGLKRALPQLQEDGWAFVRLSDVAWD